MKEAWPQPPAPEKSPDPGRPKYYPPGQAPWERARAQMGEASEIPEHGGYNVAGWDAAPRPRIGDLTPFELDMIYRSGNLEPIRVRLLAESDEYPDPESASPRDLLVGNFTSDLAHGEVALDLDLDTMREQLEDLGTAGDRESQKAAERFRDKIKAYEDRQALLRRLAERIEKGEALQ